MKTMRWIVVACGLVILLGTSGLTAQNPTVAPSGLPCEAVGEIQFICNLVSPEDLAVIPGSDCGTISAWQECD
jgi:hypothetical protein